MARHFTRSSSEYITFDEGAADSLGGGALTLIALHKPASNHRGGILQSFEAGGFSSIKWTVFDSDTMFINTNGFASIGSYGTGTWLLDVVTKAAGTATPRRHTYNFGTTSWSHANGSGTIDNSGSIPSTSLRVGLNATDEYYDGDIAALAGWGSVPFANDAAVEASGIETQLSSWMDLDPTFCWRFNQASTATAVVDITGGGADQLTISGTSVSTDPAGFDYYIPGFDAPPNFRLKVRIAGVWVPLAVA